MGDAGEDAQWEPSSSPTVWRPRLVCLGLLVSPGLPGLPEAVPLLAGQSVTERAPGVTGLGACGVKGGAYTEASPVLRVTLLSPSCVSAPPSSWPPSTPAPQPLLWRPLCAVLGVICGPQGNRPLLVPGSQHALPSRAPGRVSRAHLRGCLISPSPGPHRCFPAHGMTKYIAQHWGGFPHSPCTDGKTGSGRGATRAVRGPV